MRRSLFLAAPLAIVLAGCGGDDESTTTAAREPGPTTAAAQTEPAPTATAAQSSGRVPARVSGSRPKVQTIAGGLTVPWDIAFLPDGRALVTERGGAVRIVSASGKLAKAVAARVPVLAEGEGGLLGAAIDPEFAGGQRFAYLYATTPSGVEVQRYRVRGSRLTKDATVLDGITAGPIHDSGRLRFGPDGNLYVTTGDAGEGESSQDASGRNGKVLRLTPEQYRGDRPADPQIYALGMRNPQGLDWEPGTDRLFTTDHGASGQDGPSGDDEVNLVREGANHGWPEARGRDHGRFAGPAHLWPETVAPSGLAFVKQPGSSWTGDILVGTLAGNSLRRLKLDGDSVTSDRSVIGTRYGRLRAVVEAPDGSIWVTTSNQDGRGSPARDDDRILRVVPPRG